MIRVLVAAETLIADATLPLDDDEAHHLDVRRVAAGDAVEAIDGAGRRGVGVMERERKRWSVQITAVEESPRPPLLVLAVGGGDKDRFLWLAEKCAELGVSRLIPIETARTRHVESRLRSGTVEKGRRRAREACKQSGNAWAPVIDDITPLDSLAIAGVRWLLADGAGAVVPTIAPMEGIAWLVGPEGGFTDADLTVIQERFSPTPATLGAHVLRFETAAIAAAVVTHAKRRDA